MIIHTTVPSWLRSRPQVVPLTIASLLVVASIGYGSMGSFNPAPRGSQSGIESTAKVGPAAASIGKTTRDGTFAFVVTSAQRHGRTLASRSGTDQVAEGEFLIVQVNVTNVGGEARRLTATDQLVISDRGHRYAPSAAVTSLEDADKAFLTMINPGSTVIGAALLFDVPLGTRIASIELHASMSSTGVQVTLPALS